MRDLVAQRVLGVALGYEDLNDHDHLRADSVLAMLVGKPDVLGASRVRERDQGCPLASSSTLNRLELSEPTMAPSHRYRKIAGDFDVFVESYPKPPREIWLDLDATDDPQPGLRNRR